MASSDNKKEVVIGVGDEVLAALGTIADVARQTLGGKSFGVSTSGLINSSNMMVGVGNPERHAHALNTDLREALRRLLFEPFVSRIEVEWKNENRPRQTFYLARLSAAGLNNAGSTRLLTNGARKAIARPALQVGVVTAVKSPASMAAVGTNVIVSEGSDRVIVP